MTADRAILDVASKNREDFLFNIYLMGKNSIEISADGRFKQTLSGIESSAVLIFKLIKKGLGDVYYVRHLR